MKTFIATFGWGQPYQDRFFRVTAEDKTKATEEMFRLFGDQWSMLYNSEKEAGVEEYGLRELK